MRSSQRWQSRGCSGTGLEIVSRPSLEIREIGSSGKITLCCSNLLSWSQYSSLESFLCVRLGFLLSVRLGFLHGNEDLDSLWISV